MADQANDTTANVAVNEGTTGVVQPEAVVEQATEIVPPPMADGPTLTEQATELGNQALTAVQPGLDSAKEVAGTAKNLVTESSAWESVQTYLQEAFYSLGISNPEIPGSGWVFSNTPMIAVVVSTIVLAIILYKVIPVVVSILWSIVKFLVSLSTFSKSRARRTVKNNAINSGSLPKGTPVTFDGITVTSDGNTNFITANGTVMPRDEYADMISAGSPNDVIGGLMPGSVIGLPMVTYKGKLERANLTLDTEGLLSGKFAGQEITGWPLYSVRCFSTAIVQGVKEDLATAEANAKAEAETDAKKQDEEAEQALQHAQELDDARAEGAAAALENHDHDETEEVSSQS
jgi:hypothetical protein